MRLGTQEALFLLPIIPIVFGLICRAISNGRGMKGGFWWGFLLGIIGVIVVAVRPNDKQEASNNVAPAVAFNNTSTRVSDSDEIKKYKELLDSGIITQEEFEAKKKQLLGL